jgi:microcystin-dependent protein
MKQESVSGWKHSARKNDPTTSTASHTMSEPFLGEIKIISWNYAPKNWAFCNGQLLPINQNQALFSLLGTTYGGDGRINFGLPDFRGRVPTHRGGGLTEGEKGGEEFHTLIQSEMPTHNHFVSASTSAGNSKFIQQTVPAPSQNILANSGVSIYGPPSNLSTLEPSSITNTGGSQAHGNQQPYLVLNIVIALVGIFPSRN